MNHVSDDMPTCVVHYDADGDPTFIVCGNVRFLIVDERAPNDRIYSISNRVEAADLVALIGKGPVGHRGDARHAAVSARIQAVLKRRNHLTVIKSRQGEGGER